MPLKGVYYRIRTYPSGKRVRLAINALTGKVVETKPLPAGATRTRRRVQRRAKKIMNRLARRRRR